VQIKELMAANVPLIDVRREDEWKSTGIIENSHLITFFDKNGNYDLSNFVMLLSKVDNSIENVILFCRTGRRTTVIAKALEKTGKFGKIYNTKGIKMWATGNNTLKSYQK
jgi:rhodanese-related sulfurtransferase